MSNVERPGPDVLVLRLSQYHSLDLVRLPRARRYRIVFAERFGVQRRAFVEVSFEQAMTVAKFLASIGTPSDEPDELPPLPLPPPVLNQTPAEPPIPESIESEGTRPFPPPRWPSTPKARGDGEEP